jgi:hypothetical protein
MFTYTELLFSYFLEFDNTQSSGISSEPKEVQQVGLLLILSMWSLVLDEYILLWNKNKTFK